MAEESARRDIRPQLQVFASDLDTGSLATAREGRFPAAIEADVSEERLRRFFDREGDHYRIKREVRDIVLFATHSLLKDPPFSRLDMISCRNLLIYLDRELQQQTCETFAYALVPGGFLFLGNSENADSPPGLFHVVDREARIFRSSERKGERLTLPKLMIGPSIPEPVGARPTHRPSQYIDASLHWQALEEAAPPSALVNETYGLVHLSENAGRYLQHPRGPLTSDITELVRPELRLQLRGALHRAFEQDQSSLTLPIAVKFNGAQRQVYLQIRPVGRDNAPPAALVMFIEGSEVTGDQPSADTNEVPRADGEALRQLYEELHATRGRLKASLEEHESASEELRAANEELQSINEEYRSTAEELETSKEELQSVNEELQTVNNELKLKLEGVSRAHSDLQNLISATDVGTLFLDAALHIKRFTPRVSDLFNITASDEGRPITDFTHRLKYDRLPEDARRILADLGSLEKEIESQNGQWYLMRIRPYRTVQDRIEGVVVTFVDVTARRKAEEDLRESETRLQLAREAATLGVLDYNPVRQQMWWDDRARELWGIGGETAELDTFWKGIHPDDVTSIREAVAKAMEPRNGGSIDCEFRVRSPGRSEERWIRMHGKAFFEGNGQAIKAVRLVNTVQDVSSRKLWEINQKLLLGELSHRVKNMLSIVQAMARQTFRGSGAPEQTLQSFEARLRSLSGAHELLIASDWKGADLATLVDQQLDSHLGSNSKQLIAEGPNVRLAPQLAVPFAMMVHELATNALKYGALSNARGSVSLTWSVSGRDGKQFLRVRWQEKGGPRVSKPPNSGFGSYLIEHGLPEATVRREFEPAGLVCTIEVPLTGTPSGL
jgi:two-component system CheB/CheR fusion protein